MPAKTTKPRQADPLEKVQRVLAATLDVSEALTRIGVREGSPQAKRLLASEATNPARADAWRRFAALFIALAPSRPRTVQRAFQFYIPDGKYQLQVFALDDGADGTLSVCCENVLSAAIEAKLLAALPDQPGTYRIPNSTRSLQVEQLDGKTENPPPYVSAMTGWNRKAMRIVLPTTLSAEQISTAENICALSALRWWVEPVQA